ncbi:hypothetical protein ACFVY0_33970 [Streptomyces sp. NPDC058286]|uniref:hypothetical protein n=1 Tax=Streptomyces sp. NPDC058286 TaxID=3346422 RepID=UPI0036E4FD53
MLDVLRALFRRPSLSSTSVAPPSRGHACAPVVDTVPLPSPLLTELIALGAHTRHLGWLSDREHCPEQYQRLARAVLQDLLDGWRAQTDGAGRLDDLIQPNTHTQRQVPRTRCGSPMEQSQPHMTTQEFT